MAKKHKKKKYIAKIEPAKESISSVIHKCAKCGSENINIYNKNEHKKGYVCKSCNWNSIPK